MTQQPYFGSSRNPMQPLSVPGEQQAPDERTVEKFHRKSDVDSRREAQHHTLGTDINQASPGNHRHDGSDSVLILEGTTITGSRSTNLSNVIGSIIAALVKLGASDQTSP